MHYVCKSFIPSLEVKKPDIEKSPFDVWMANRRVFLHYSINHPDRHSALPYTESDAFMVKMRCCEWRPIVLHVVVQKVEKTCEDYRQSSEEGWRPEQSTAPQ